MNNKKITKEEIEEFQKFITKYTDLYFYEYLNNSGTSKFSYAENYLLNYTERFYFNWLSIKNILPLILESTGFNHALGILARSCVIDAITASYLSLELKIEDKIIVDDKNFINETLRLDFDFQKTVYDLIKGQNYETEKFNEIIKNRIENLRKEIKDLFYYDEALGIYKYYKKEDANKNNIKYYGRLNITNMVEKLQINQQNHNTLHYLYNLYSQYEHFSIHAKELQNGYNQENFKSLQYSLNCTLLTNSRIFTICNKENITNEMYKLKLESDNIIK